MNFRNTQNFAFKNTFQPKTIDISFKKNQTSGNESDDICDEIESLLSELENKSAIDLCDAKNKDTVSNQEKINKKSISDSKPEIIELKKNEKTIENEKKKQEDVFEFKLPKKCSVPSFKSIKIIKDEETGVKVKKDTNFNAINQIKNLLKNLEEDIIKKEQEYVSNTVLLDKQRLQNNELISDNNKLAVKNKDYIEQISKLEQKAETITHNRNKIQALQNELDTYKAVIDNELKYKEKQYKDIKEYNEILVAEKQNVLKGTIEGNKKLQHEIDDLQRKLHACEKENADLLEQQQKSKIECINKLKESEKQEKMYKDVLNENEKKLKLIENKYTELQKRQTEMSSLIETNQQLRKELNEKNNLETIVLNKDKEITNYKFEIQKLKDENSSIIAEINEKNQQIQEQSNKNKELLDNLCEKKATYNGHIHNFRLYIQNIRKTSSEINCAMMRVEKIRIQDILAKMKDYYQRKFEFEMKKNKREKMELTSQIQILMEAHKKYKTNAGFAKIKSNYIEPSDSDIWNVFN